MFIGALAMFDIEFYAGRWAAETFASTRVEAVFMSREGLDRFLVERPLAQVRACSPAGRSPGRRPAPAASSQGREAGP
jgi:hypothetical protein